MANVDKRSQITFPLTVRDRIDTHPLVRKPIEGPELLTVKALLWSSFELVANTQNAGFIIVFFLSELSRMC